jgi:hypothetical protein
MNFKQKIFFLPAVFLLIAYFMRLGTIPNQLVIIGVTIILLFVFLIIFLVRQLKCSKKMSHKIVHFLGFLLTIPILLLPLAGVFDQGIIPVAIYFVLLLTFIFYLIKRTDAAPNSIKPDNYRNFMLLNLLFIIFNSPILTVLPDIFYSPDFKPEYVLNKGPKIYIDEWHNNLRTKDGLYTTFTNILEKDGYNVKSFNKKITSESLKGIEILVISNALNDKNVKNWNSPVFSAFTKSEIQDLNDWVKTGGALFFIADHMPFGSATKDLAQSFGYVFLDGSVIKKDGNGPDLFSRKGNTLEGNSITNGRNASEFVDSIVTFTGQAIEIPAAANPILVFSDEYAHYLPKIRKHIEDVEAENITGRSQGSYMEYGSGRLVVFGEAAMFSGQLPAGLTFWKKIGLNAPAAKNNYKLLLNIVHWLDRKMD